MTLMPRVCAACVFALACHFVAAPRLFGGYVEGPPTDAALVANKILENYQRFREIPNLTVDFEMTYQLLAGQRRFAFDAVRVVTNRRGEKQRLRISGTALDTLAIDREFAWDEKVATGIEMIPPARIAGDYTINHQINSSILYYNYYVNFLNYPDAAGRVPLVVGPNQRVKAARWLPDSLVKALSNYVMRSAADGSEGAPCVVMDDPARESFWFDPAKGYALRRHDTYDPATKALQERTTFSDFRNVGPIWLPATITRVEFGGPDDPETVENQPRAQYTLKVNSFSTSELAADFFRLPAPVGVTVHDVRRKVFYTRFKTGENPLIASAELARIQVDRSDPPWLLMASTVILALVLVGLGWRIHRANTSRKMGEL